MSCLEISIVAVFSPSMLRSLVTPSEEEEKKKKAAEAAKKKATEEGRAVEGEDALSLTEEEQMDRMAG